MAGDTDTMSVASYSSLTRETAFEYYLSGAPSQILYGDAMPTGETGTYTHLDPRGFLTDIQIVRSGTAQHVAPTRNVAGLVTMQHVNITGEPITYVESDWTYDKLGRVSSQIDKTSAGTAAEQALTYLGNDDLATLDQYLGTNHKTFQFGYDTRHQLTSTTETTTTGYFNAAYGYGNAGRLANAFESTLSTPPTGSEVVPRTLDYHYAGDDPEEVTSLVNNAQNGNTHNVGQPYATYTYDEVGNQLTRCVATSPFGAVSSPCNGEETDYVYDGKDQLRRATKKLNGVVQGSEEYWYGGGGQRMITVKRDASGNKTEMIWWIDDVEAHYDPSGTNTLTYSHVSLGTPLARVARTSSTDAPLEYQFHGLGNSTLAAISETGTINASFSYAPFGEIIEATDAGSGNNAGIEAHRRRVNDKYVDEISDLAYYGFRYYDKALIGWTQADPLYRFVPEARYSYPRRGNLYGFSLNNPLRYIDPDGRDSWTRGAQHWTRNTRNYALQAALAKNAKGAVYGAPTMDFGGSASGAAKTSEIPAPTVAPGDYTGYAPIDFVEFLVDEIESGEAEEFLSTVADKFEEAASSIGGAAEEAIDKVEEAASAVKNVAEGAIETLGEGITFYHGSDVESVTSLVENNAVDQSAAAELGGGDVFWMTTNLEKAGMFASANPAGGQPAIAGLQLSIDTVQSMQASGAVEISGDVAQFHDWDELNRVCRFFKVDF